MTMRLYKLGFQKQNTWSLSYNTEINKLDYVHL